MKPTKLDKINVEEKVYDTVSELYNKGLKIIKINIINYQMLKKINTIKSSTLRTYKSKIMMNGLQKKN